MSNQNLISKRTLSFLSVGLALSCCILTKTAYGQQTQVTKVAFEKDKFNRIFMPVKIDKDTITLLFGTYSKTLRVTPYFMETRELYPSGDFLTQTDKEGRRKGRMVFYMPKVEVGNVKFKNEETIVNFDFPDSVATGSTGTMFVYQYNWRIDNDRNEISISKSPFTPNQPFTTIHYKNNSYPIVPVEIAGIKDDFAVDFGSGTNIQVSTTTALGKELIASYNLKPTLTLTTNVHRRKLTDTLYEVEIPSLQFNGIELKNQKVTLSSVLPRNTVGSAFLGKYNIILNNSKKRKIDNVIILEKRLVD